MAFEYTENLCNWHSVSCQISFQRTGVFRALALIDIDGNATTRRRCYFQLNCCIMGGKSGHSSLSLHMFSLTTVLTPMELWKRHQQHTKKKTDMIDWFYLAAGQLAAHSQCWLMWSSQKNVLIIQKCYQNFSPITAWRLEYDVISSSCQSL